MYDLPQAKVEIYEHEVSKYEDPGEGVKSIFTGVISWDIVEGGNEALDIEMNTCEYTPIDDHHEYLVLHFEDGTKRIFRNSYVDMFIW
jgi:hypothetical protein